VYNEKMADILEFPAGGKTPQAQARNFVERAAANSPYTEPQLKAATERLMTILAAVNQYKKAFPDQTVEYYKNERMERRLIDMVHNQFPDFTLRYVLLVADLLTELHTPQDVAMRVLDN